jgi:hypothetical protein
LRSYLEEIAAAPLENREHGCGDLLHCPHDILYQKKLELTSPTSSSSSVSIVHLRTKATEFSSVYTYYSNVQTTASEVSIITSFIFAEDVNVRNVNFSL